MQSSSVSSATSEIDDAIVESAYEEDNSDDEGSGDENNKASYKAKMRQMMAAKRRASSGSGKFPDSFSYLRHILIRLLVNLWAALTDSQKEELAKEDGKSGDNAAAVSPETSE